MTKRVRCRKFYREVLYVERDRMERSGRWLLSGADEPETDNLRWVSPVTAEVPKERHAEVLAVRQG